MWVWDKLLLINIFPYLFTTQSGVITTLDKKALENIVGKGENAGNQHFLHFLQGFQLYQAQNHHFNV